MPLSDRMIWVDVESFGLDYEKDFVTEVGFKITDLDLKTIDDFQIEIWSTPEYDTRFAEMKLSTADRYVYNMHVKSGLWDQCHAHGAAPAAAEKEMNDFLEGHGIKDGEEPLCGSSVDFDRNMLKYQFPSVFERFHYRVVDISTIKTLCAAYAPDLYEQMDPNKKRELHRVLPDLDDTIGEFKFYRDNFLFETR